MPRWMVKSCAVGPGLAISTVITFMVGAALSPLAGLGLFAAGAAIATTLAFGGAEASAARVLLASRRLRAHELEDLAPALTQLCQVHLGPPLIELRVRPWPRHQRPGRRPTHRRGLGRPA